MDVSQRSDVKINTLGQKIKKGNGTAGGLGGLSVTIQQKLTPVGT